MKNREEILKEHSVEKTELELTESDLDEESFDEYDDGSGEETVITEDEWELTESGEVDELFLAIVLLDLQSPRVVIHRQRLEDFSEAETRKVALDHEVLLTDPLRYRKKNSLRKNTSFHRV